MKTKGILFNRKCVPRFNSYGNCMEITFMTLKRKMTLSCNDGGGGAGEI